MWEAGWGASSTEQERGDSRKSEGEVQTFGQKEFLPCSVGNYKYGKLHEVGVCRAVWVVVEG